jgi:hypothetical protein
VETVAAVKSMSMSGSVIRQPVAIRANVAAVAVSAHALMSAKKSKVTSISTSQIAKKNGLRVASCATPVAAELIRLTINAAVIVVPADRMDTPRREIRPTVPRLKRNHSAM